MRVGRLKKAEEPSQKPAASASTEVVLDACDAVCVVEVLAREPCSQSSVRRATNASPFPPYPPIERDWSKVEKREQPGIRRDRAPGHETENLESSC